MADQRIQSTEEMVGAGHATKADTLNRLALVEHNNDGTHKDQKVLARQHTASSVTGTLIETTLFSTSVPASTMGVNGVLRITTLWSFVGANAKTIKVKFGGTIFLNVSTSSSLSAQAMTIIRNRNSASAQIASVNSTTTSFGSSSSANMTAAVNTAVAQTLEVTATLANVGDTITLEAITAEVQN